MKRFKAAIALPVVAALLASCAPPPLAPEEEVVHEEAAKEKTLQIPELQLQNNYYRNLLPFKEGEGRGLIVNNVYTKYDMQEVETGLLRLSTNYFSPDDHFFQEGQYIERDVLEAWLSRVSRDEKGLNPESSNTGQDEKNPLYLAHITEQNYLKRSGDNKVSLAGISIGLSLNSIYYNPEGKEIDIPDATVQEEGKKLAERIVKRMRNDLNIKEVPIVVALFKQEPRNSIVPGTYFAVGKADVGKEAVSEWTPINEEYVLFPGDGDKEYHRDMNQTFKKFKQDIDEYFPSFVSVIGRGFYKDGELQSLRVEIPIQFFGTSEVIGFAQHLTALVDKYFTTMQVEVSVTSVNGPEVLIVRKPGDEEPYVHIYNY
ncbi:CamS family sex pheromone protein [Planococcaceae bacterium Storch 2/2-2]|nr:CamS family sex pheromone protein [Planococcaceae bacterium Storch 2/2-2]